jgi:hypothetical protein
MNMEIGGWGWGAEKASDHSFSHEGVKDNLCCVRSRHKVRQERQCNAPASCAAILDPAVQLLAVWCPAVILVNLVRILRAAATWI